MELYVLRHGTTEWNKTHRLQGRTDIPLDGEGTALAKETGEGMKGIRFDRCYSSPLRRAYETARLVLGSGGPEIITDPRLIEISFGEWEGHVIAEGVEGYDARAAAALDFRIDSGAKAPGGESIPEVIARTKDFYEALLADPDNENRRILLSMHGCSGRAFMLNLWGGDSFWHGGVPKNCTVCVARIRNGRVLDIDKDVAFYHSEVEDYYR